MDGNDIQNIIQANLPLYLFLSISLFPFFAHLSLFFQDQHSSRFPIWEFPRILYQWYQSKHISGRDSLLQAGYYSQHFSHGRDLEGYHAGAGAMATTTD